ncbi:4-oxalocrotonate tautomerase family protein [Stappia sp. WLB 29]|uniref:tautomerase family protein n=1 Tax=Stappia sp. WLB 29 TaxID=2925220 RepID=UPI0020C047B0|nr:4-oxalocrotonate tautomerase family protein [Stappia sp. WLB 29]
MPYVNIKVTREGVTREQKARLIAGVTDLLIEVLDKDPATTFVVIDEVDLENWGIAGVQTDVFRARKRATSPQ